MKLSIVVPVYREEGNIPVFISRTTPILEKITPDYEIIFALDPSPDKTADVILEARRKDPRIKLLEFSRRFGQPMATLAGMQYSKGEAVVVMDVDLQDPPELVADMVAKWREGFDVVYAQRKRREGLGLFYRMITFVGYQLIRRSADVGVQIPPNVGDFRLMSRRVVDEVLKLKESHGFLRGLVAVVGFRQTAIVFDRPARKTGESNYSPFVGSLRIGLNGLVCFSTGLLKATSLFGFFIAGLSFLVAAAYAVMKLNGVPFPLGNPTVVILVLFLGGVQLISVGILGEYIARIYDEVKQRPRFIVDEKHGFE
jgi:glycosyltransferase involved in cell wall biosynthesis